jgi:hypothetical protein
MSVNKVSPAAGSIFFLGSGVLTLLLVGSQLLKRIVTPELSQEQLQRLQKVDDLAYHLHDFTHGINSDPLLALAITMSALIHDVGKCWVLSLYDVLKK